MKNTPYTLNLNWLARYFAVLILALLPLVSLNTASAAVTAKFSLSPASKTVTVGNNLVVYLMLDTGGNSVLAWKTAITYSTSAFNSVSVATDASSHFTLNPATDIASSGTIKIARYATSASSTNGAMAKITLHSSGVGNATLSFAHKCSSTADTTPCSAIVGSGGTNLLSTLTNGSYTIAAVPTSGSSSGSTSGSTTTTTTKKKSLLSKVSDAIAAVVSPSSSAEDVTTTKKSVIISRGVVQISVFDKQENPISGAKVTLAGVSGVTDRNGQVVLTGLKTGEANGTITYNGKTQNIKLTIKSGTSLDSPQFASLSFSAAGGSKVLPILAALIGLAVIIGLIDLIFISKGGFKANMDNVLHHNKHDTMTPGQIIKPNSKV